jgi:hypothetical protein
MGNFNFKVRQINAQIIMFFNQIQFCQSRCYDQRLFPCGKFFPQNPQMGVFIGTLSAP